ncbi:protein LSM14 homolog car-1-like isoform X2 [Paramacrobiotus metropolitanus]|uniref:protein LSM14 homolog car-1-like isoform X2 n=1 Tax=Paramacrobiotus metropolitanus TaxID=2943436 RepID=UPI002445B243|nr:protein LSM14 homolog car-1-like isoform X2 [Paramacrobiotus metropolitanus]
MAATGVSLQSLYNSAPAEMPQVDPQVFVGSKISIISNSNIRYEGILYAYNEQNATISLQNVRSFGSEDRLPLEKAVQPPKDLFEYIIFRVTDIKDLEVSEPPKVDMPPRPRTRNNSNPACDPAIVKSAVASSASGSGGGMMQSAAAHGMSNNGPAWRFAPSYASGGAGHPGTGGNRQLQQQGGRGRRGRMRRGRGWGSRGPSMNMQGMLGGAGVGLGAGPGVRPGMINPAQHVKLLKEYQNVVPPVSGSAAEPLDTNLDLESFSTMAQKFEIMDKTGQAGLSVGNLLAGSIAESNATGGNTAVPVPETDPKKYYNPDDNFFDKISCEALDPNQGVQPRNWRRENQLNNNTFGRPPRFNAGNSWNMAGNNWNAGGRGPGGNFGYGGQGRGGNRRGGGRGQGRAGMRNNNRGQWNNQQQSQWNGQSGQWNTQPGQRRQGGWGGSTSWNQGRSNAGWNDGNTSGRQMQRGGWNQSGQPGTMNNWTHGPVPQQMQIQSQPTAGTQQQPPLRGRGRRGGMGAGRQWVGSILPPAAKEVLQQQLTQQHVVALGEPRGELPTDGKLAMVEWTFPVDIGSAAADLQATRDAAGSSNKENSDYDIIGATSPDQAER